jgi:membrane protease YdiL (CAAX protease family)
MASEKAPSAWKLPAGVAAVVASMCVLFTVPPGAFVPATFVSTSCMIAASWSLGLRWRGTPTLRAVLAGLASAAALYLVFAAGDAWIKAFHPLGIGAESAASIYSLIVSPGNAVYTQVAVLLFDSAGYESFFRGVLQARLKPRLGPGSAAAVAAFDAAVHIMTLNPLWVATTFVADLAWGLTFHYSGRLSASFVSHLAWDLAVFLAFPLR